MTTFDIMKKLYKEIDTINAEIDAKIIKGLSYKNLASKHKLLMEELRSIEPQPIVSKGIMSRLASYVSVFLM